MTHILGTVSVGLLYSFVTLGVFLSFRVLRFPDLTVDGTFTLGGSVSAVLITLGYSPYIATVFAITAGFFAGTVTGILSQYMRLIPLLSGILTMMILYSLNLRILSSGTVSLFDTDTLFTGMELLRGGLLFQGTLVACVCFFLYRFLLSEKGLALRATGGNPAAAACQGISTKFVAVVGLGISNALVAFGGSIFVQSQEFASPLMGIGTIIIALASLLLGESLRVSSQPSLRVVLFLCCVGSFVYRLLVSWALRLPFFDASDVQMLSALFVLGAIVVTKVRSRA